jgi:hypothetical protein
MTGRQINCLEKGWCKEIAHTFSYTVGHDYVMLETKLVVIRYTIVSH